MAMFKTIILIGRPASGKSEFIDFLKQVPEAERVEQFHIGRMTEFDDFVWLWEKFVEDDLWEAAGYPRIFSKRAGHAYAATNGTLLDFCFAKFNAEYPKVEPGGTVFIEFSRGTPDGGYAYALSRLSDELLRDAAILFIHTSYEEACRRNEARYQAKLKHSILAHKVPPEDMERFAQSIDWLPLTGERPWGHLPLRLHRIPFLTVQNEPELKDPGPLAARYQPALRQLMELYQTRRGERNVRKG